MGGSTIVVGLNAALQKRFILPPDGRLVPGDVHRARSVQVGVGGKGQDVAITLSCLQFTGNLKLAHFIGSGAEGDLVYQMLDELLGEDAMELTVRTAGGMRTCTSIVASDKTTELVEPSDTIAESEMNQLLEQLSQQQASALCIMGSLPPGLNSNTYANIYKTVATSTTLCLIDSVVGLTELLAAIAATEPRGSTMLKINASELCRLVGIAVIASETSGVPLDQVTAAVTAFLAEPNAARALTAIAITDGAHPAHLAVLPLSPDENEFRVFQLPIAKLTSSESSKSGWGKLLSSPAGSSSPQTLYPIGAGDAVAAGTLAAWKCLTDDPECVPPDVQAALEGNQSPSTRAMLAAFSFGVACGTASCLQEQNSVLKLQDVYDLFNKEGRPVFVSSHAMP
jgi:fructose-1-phosphate kinase PfkB-like protein